MQEKETLLTATPPNRTPELIPTMSQVLCFCTPDGLHRAQPTSVIQPTPRREKGTSHSLLRKYLQVTSRESGYQLLNQPARARGSKSKWVLETPLPFLGNSHTAESPSQTARASTHPLNHNMLLLRLPGRGSCRQTRGNCDVGRAAGDTLPG